MSTDEKANEVSGEAADQEPITPSSETEGSGHGAEGGAGGRALSPMNENERDQGDRDQHVENV